MALALRLLAASVVFGGMLVWWAMMAVAVMAVWLVFGVVLAFGGHLHLCRRRLTRRGRG